MAFPGAKTTLYELGMKLPLIVRRPGKAQKGTDLAALISWVDITPTILDYAGAKPGKAIQGKSFRAVLENNKTPVQLEIYASHSLHEITMYYPMRVIRTPQYKLIYNIANRINFSLSPGFGRIFSVAECFKSRQ